MRGTTVTTGAQITLEKQNAIRRSSGENGVHRANSMNRRPASEAFLEENVRKLVTQNDQKTNALRAIKSRLLGDSGNSTGSGNEDDIRHKKSTINRTLSQHNKLQQSKNLQQKHGLKRSNTTTNSSNVGSNSGDGALGKLGVRRNASDSQTHLIDHNDKKQRGLDPAGIGDARRRFNLEVTDHNGSILDKYIANARETAWVAGKRNVRSAVEMKKEEEDSESDYTNSSA